jgi:multidrug efflux pump subunit AcrB
MWIVRLAPRRPYTFVVVALLIAVLGGVSIATMPVDIFPYIDIPVVSVVWQCNGLTPEEMESRIVTNFERALTSNVVGIEHIESQSHQSIAAVRVYFHPTAQVDLASVPAADSSCPSSVPPQTPRAEASPKRDPSQPWRFRRRCWSSCTRRWRGWTCWNDVRRCDWFDERSVRRS